MNMTNVETRDIWQEKLDAYLHLACEAEGKGNYLEAELQLKKALYYEAKILVVMNIKKYIEAAGPVYRSLEPTGGTV